MGSEQLATQSELGEFNEALALLAENLAYHINGPLDKGHGVALVKGYVDGYGNDLRIYQDSNGDTWSNTDVNAFNFIRFVINGQPYYAPALDTALAGQPEDTGALVEPDAISDEPIGTTLITEFVTLESAAAVNTNSLLLEHTRKSSQNAHFALSALSSSVLDSNGDTVGRNRVRIQVNNFVWEIPADTRLGGPFQNPRLTSSLTPSVYFAPPIHGTFYYNTSNNTVYYHVDGGDPWPSYVRFTYTGIKGTRPLCYLWEYKIGTGNWTRVPRGGFQTGNGCGLTPIDWTNRDDVNPCQIDDNPPDGDDYIAQAVDASGEVFLRCGLRTPGGDDSGAWYLRLTITNEDSGGTSVSFPAFYNHMKDRSSSWLCTVAYHRGYIPKHIYLADLIYTQRHVSRAVKDGYALWAFPLSRQLYRHNWLLLLWLPAIKAWTYHMAYLHGVHPKDNLAGTVIFNVVRPICGLLGYCAWGVRWVKQLLRLSEIPSH